MPADRPATAVNSRNEPHRAPHGDPDSHPHGGLLGDLHSDPQLDARVRPDFERSGLLRHLGARLGLVLPGEVHVHLAYSADITQQNGFFHAGATSTIADTAGGFAGLTVFRPGHSVLTVEFKINLLAPAQGESLEAIGRVIRSGRTLTIAQVDVYAIRSGKKAHVALAQQTLIAIPEK